ncbi:MAG: NAD(+) diphosphatase [Propioniciclava sp.]
MEDWLPDSRLDRVLGRREDAPWIAGLWARDDTTVLGVAEDARVGVDVVGHALRGTRPTEPYDPQRHCLIGLIDERAWFAAPTPDPGACASLREIAGFLDATDLHLAMSAVALVTWHREAPFCSRCGSPTQMRAGGQQRWCPRCERLRFPRTDPAVIVAVVDADDRLLLAHQALWDPTRMSLLAGFVEAGESLEQAVHREIAEESGVRLRAVGYVGSQPWPFPRSLMLGFVARADASPIAVDGVEIDRARYFTRTELTDAIAVGEVSLPGPASIAHRIIAAWRAGGLRI